jgi:hypothetical protein
MTLRIVPMRKTLALGLIIAAVGATAYVASDEPAWAQACQTTCSNAEVLCKQTTKMDKECTAEYKKCLKTGTFKNPKGGTTWTSLCKS